MSVNGFNDEKSDSKGIVNRESDGLSVGSSWSSLSSSPFNTYEVAVKKGGKQSDSTEVFTGPGTGIATGVGSAEDTVGWVTSTGNRIAINGTAGSESIEIIHHSGAQIIIDVDGSIFLMPTGKKGFGVHSSKGDGVVSAQGRLVLVGKSDITIETEGSMSFNVGQNMFMNIGGDMVLDVSGSFSESIDGAKSTEVVKDITTTTGGILRETIAGDRRTQVVGNSRYDIGKSMSIHTGQDIQLMSQKSVYINSKEDSTYEVESGKLSLISTDDTTLATKNALYITSKDDISIEAADTLALRSGGSTVMSSKATTYIDSTSEVDIRSNSINLSATGQLQTLSGTTRINSSGTIDVNSTGAIDMRGSTIDLNKASASVTSVRVVETTTPRGVPDLQSPLEPEYPDANTIIDNMTSERESPGFILNANKMSAHDMSIYENEGDIPDSNAKARARLNTSAGSLYSKGADGDQVLDSSNIGYDGSGNKTKAVQSPYTGTIESIYNTNEKISRNVTIGSFPGLGSLPTNQMGYSRKEILENVLHLSYNIIDPLIEKFGSSLRLTHGIRLGAGGSRHYIGKAVDISTAGKDHAEIAMIAKWIVENLPYDRCFLEANHQGTIHIHVEAAPIGTSGSKEVWTCSEPSCSTKISGIQLSYAQQGLKNMGFV
jgi:hypothetical protein